MTTVHVEWGMSGATALAAECDVVVVCDVLSFSTAVSVAVARGIEVWPHRWRDASAGRRAAALGAVLAGERGDGASLSPASIDALPTGSRLLLPSPNGATCCVVAAELGAMVIAGCLRNAPAVAAWLHDNRRRLPRVGLVAAGEQWPDGSLRPAYEDWVGAGALSGLLMAHTASPEAAAAAMAASARRSLREVASGAELVDAGFAGDVDAAEAAGADDVVPLLVDGRFIDARSVDRPAADG